jgi:hypothetical protein
LLGQSTIIPISLTIHPTSTWCTKHDIVARFGWRLIKVESSLMVPGWSNRWRVGIKALMPEIPMDGAWVLDGC